MGSKRRFHTLQMLCFILAFWPHFSLSSEGSKQVYGSIRKNVQLEPEVTKPISSITWKKENNKIAEWDRNSGHDYYGRCSTGGQCELNATTGVLIMKGLKQEDEGRYFAEIDGKPSQEYSLTIREHVFGLIGKDVKLDPDVTETISTITWKKEKDKIVEWVEWDKSLVRDYYGRCLTEQKNVEDQCELNCNTGVLILKRLKPEDEGRYSAEINRKTSQHDFQLFVLSERTKLVYGLIGEDVQLDPEVNEISSITWKTQDDKIAKWERNSELDYYGRCKTGDKCELNSTTGYLIMKGLKQEDTRKYFAEVNGKTSEEEFLLAVLEPVSKPIVAKFCNETQCILTCVGQESQYTRYSWKENNETVKQENKLTVHKTGDQSKSYTCVFSNPKSEEHSDRLTEKDLFPPEVYPVGSIVGGVIGGVLLVLVAGAAIFYCWKTKALEEEPPCRNGLGGQNEGNPSAPAENNTEETAMLATSKAAEAQQGNGGH